MENLKRQKYSVRSEAHQVENGGAPFCIVEPMPQWSLLPRRIATGGNVSAKFTMFISIRKSHCSLSQFNKQKMRESKSYKSPLGENQEWIKIITMFYKDYQKVVTYVKKNNCLLWLYRRTALSRRKASTYIKCLLGWNIYRIDAFWIYAHWIFACSKLCVKQHAKTNAGQTKRIVPEFVQSDHTTYKTGAFCKAYFPHPRRLLLCGLQIVCNGACTKMSKFTPFWVAVQSFCRSRWVASQNGFHWNLDTMT